MCINEAKLGFCGTVISIGVDFNLILTGLNLGVLNFNGLHGFVGLGRHLG
jgi:hypothetical protein